MSYSLEQIWLATPENIDEILTSGKVEALKNSGTLDEKRIKVARLYASPAYNFLDPNQVALVNSQDFDLTIKTYGLSKAVTLLKRPTVSFQQIKETPDNEVFRFLTSQRLPTSSSAMVNKNTLIQFYFEKGMFNAEEATLTANPKFRQYVEEGLDLQELKKPKVTLRQIWKLKVQTVNESLESVGVSPSNNPFINRVTLARLYAREGRLNEMDTRLVNSLDFDRTFTRFSNFDDHYNYRATKSIVNGVFPNDISTIVEGYAAIEAPKPEYIFVRTNNSFMVIDANSLEVIREVKPSMTFSWMDYYRGKIFFTGRDDQNTYYFDPNSLELTETSLTNNVPIGINKTTGKLLAIPEYRGKGSLRVYNIKSTPPGLKLSLPNSTDKEENGIGAIIRQILPIDDIFYTYGTSINMYSSDGQLLASTLLNGGDLYSSAVSIVGDFLMVSKDRGGVLYFYDRFSLKLVKEFEIKKFSNHLTDGHSLYYTATLDKGKRCLMKLNVKTFDSESCFELEKGEDFLIGFNRGRVYLSGVSKPKALIEIDLRTTERRVIVADLGVSNYYQTFVAFS
jgi:hypothetical protein